jgi:hypothetical protein
LGFTRRAMKLLCLPVLVCIDQALVCIVHGSRTEETREGWRAKRYQRDNNLEINFMTSTHERKLLVLALVGSVLIMPIWSSSDRTAKGRFQARSRPRDNSLASLCLKDDRQLQGFVGENASQRSHQANVQEVAGSSWFYVTVPET